MQTLVDVTSGLTNTLFVALAVTCLVRWRRRNSAPAKWAALTFGVLGAVALAGWVISKTGGADVEWQGKLTLALLLSFPYCLYRFTAAFGPRSRRVDRAATYSWALVVVVTLLIPELPRPGAGRPAWFQIYLLALLAEWTALALVATTKLWRSGRGQTTVVRRRMRLLSVASVGMSVALVTAGSAQGGSEGLGLALQLLALASSLLFFAGLAPPQFLLVSWRRREEVNLDRAVQSLVAATTRDEVTTALLPNVVALLGGRAAALTDDQGRMLGVDGIVPDDAASALPATGDRTGSRGSVEIPLHSGRLVVWVSPYTPFFGNKELERLRSLGSLLDVALERIRLSEALSDAKDEAERANQAKSEFLSRMSHELRTPLNAILGFAQLLELEDLPGDQRESVQHIEKAGRHLLSLINEVLEIARIEAGKLALTLEAVEVGDALHDVVGLVRPLAAERNVELDARPSQPGPLYVTADGQRLKQVMLNLLSNAIKYNRPGGTVSLSWEQTGAQLVWITVSDTGRGIAPEEMDRLFEPFERLGADESGVEGTGLGLALSKRLLDGMGGALRGESTLGQGSRFSVELPPARPPSGVGPEETSAGRQDVVAPDRDGRTTTVLYIEDNELNRKLVAHLLAKRPGVRLLEAMQGSMGLDLAQQHRPDLILLDLNLPDMAGTDVLRRLRERPATCEIPVAVVSAEASRAQMRKLEGAGAHAYLTKPIDVRTLLAVVDEALAR